SWMVELLVGHLPREGGIECFHIDSRFSDSGEQIGRFSFKKLLRLPGYCLKAILWKFKYGIDTLYYVPAPACRTPFWRDLLVMAFCRPFFKNLVLHWHARGLGAWIAGSASPLERFLGRALLGRADLSVVLAEDNRADAGLLSPRRIAVIPNSIPDPCQDFAASMLPMRRARVPWNMNPTASASDRFRLLFIGLCHEEKGIFDAIEAVFIANRRLEGAGDPRRFTLTVAGTFPDEAVRLRFDRCLAEPSAQGTLLYAGFVSGTEKDRLFREHDCLVFPTFYSAESFGLVVVEAMAFGMPVITTRWRAVPSLLPMGSDDSNVVPVRNAAALAGAILGEAQRGYDPAWRRRFETEFQLPGFISRFETALTGMVGAAGDGGRSR
ncbi:MAG TPA: glycosyltransferase family 4 protein, partial [Roseimicrobium sp.]|nr:glycosyltransferase family 4 protein [Roseimicrobium sp.]